MGILYNLAPTGKGQKGHTMKDVNRMKKVSAISEIISELLDFIEVREERCDEEIEYYKEKEECDYVNQQLQIYELKKSCYQTVTEYLNNYKF